MTDNKSLSYLMDIDKVNKEKFSQVISDIENLKTEVSNIKSKVDSSLPVDISSVNTSISDVKSDISEVSTKADGISTDINSLNSSISGLSGNYYERNLILPKEDIYNFKHISSTYSDSTGEKTMLSVSGEGFLVYAYASSGSPWNYNTYCDIIIDGKHIKIQRTKSGSSSLMLCSKTLLGKSTYTNIGDYPLEFLTHSEANSGITFTDKYGTIARIFDGYLKFNSSLQVKCYADYADSQVRSSIDIVYALL